MLRKIVLCMLSLALALAAIAAADQQSFGTGVEIEQATAIREIVENPDAWAGKMVRIEGQVSGVCAKKGCWMELESLDGDRLRVKVEDDVIVFPREAQGRWAAAQGTVEVQDLSREQYVGWQRHLAEENGESFDEASVGDGPYRIVQIKGTGAEVRNEDAS